MNVVEIGLASILALFGLRSLWTWARRPFESRDPVDHVLYAAFVTGRVGLWFAFAGSFALYAYLDATGGSIARFRWYLVVPLVLAAMQFVGGWFLGRRAPATPARSDADVTDPAGRPADRAEPRTAEGDGASRPTP